jgi:hypothetical protein
LLPTVDDYRFVDSLMRPRIGIDNKPGDFEYVKIGG